MSALIVIVKWIEAYNMFRINFMSVKKPKIPRTRRCGAIFADDLLELKGISHQAAVSDLSSDLHTHEVPVKSEQLKVAPTVASREVNVLEDELESCTDGQATLEHGNSELPEKTYRDGLALRETDVYSNYEAFLTVFSILSYIFDVGSDVYLAFVYYSDGDIWWFTLTVIFIIVPSLTITIFSFVWYIQDDADDQLYSLIWLPRLVLLFLQLAPLLRFVASLGKTVSAAQYNG